MTFGLWATWYDIDEPARPAWFDWLHGQYLPRLAADPGHAWVAHYRYRGGGPQMDSVKSTVVNHTDDAIGQGTQFLILVGARSPHAFFTDPAFDERPDPAEFEPMLAQRRGVRTAFFTLEAQVDGPSAPAIPDPDPAPPAPAIQFGTLRPRSLEAEVDLIKWYAQYRLPTMSRMPGCVRTRKLAAIAGWPKHGILYEFESLAMRLQHFEQTHESLALDASHWTHRITRASWHAPGSPFIGERTWPAV
jgi:hypothetical protein